MHGLIMSNIAWDNNAYKENGEMSWWKVWWAHKSMTTMTK